MAATLSAFVFLSLFSPFVVLSLSEHVVGRSSQNTGEQHLLVVPVFFKDMYPSTSLEDIGGTIMQADAYLREVSYGRSWLIADVLGWTLLDQSAEYYGVPASVPCGGDELGAGDSYRLNQMVNEAITKADAHVDFRSYDRLLIFHAGYARQSAGSSGDQFRHKWIDTCDMPINHLTEEFVLVEKAMVVAEFEGRTAWLGSLVHELGHEFGADDLYNPDYGPDVGYWCLMSYGDWLNDSNTPCHMCAYTKLSIGLLNQSQIVPISNGTYQFELVAMSVNAEGFYSARFNLDRWGQVYYLLEARKKVGFDSALEREGVLVTLVNMTAPDSQHGRVLLAPDPRYPEGERIYGLGEFFIDLKSGFGLRVINETELGYLVETTTEVRCEWVRTSLIEHELKSTPGGSIAVLDNGTMYLAIQGENETSGFQQVDVYKSQDSGYSWEIVFSSPATAHRTGAVLVAKRQSSFIGLKLVVDYKPYLFCETEFSVNHTIEVWDIASRTSYNLTDTNRDARKPSVVTTDDYFFLAYELRNMTSPIWSKGAYGVCLSQGYRVSSLQYTPRTVQNASSPCLSPMPSDAPSMTEPCLVYLSGPNASYQNEMWLESFSGATQMVHSRIYSGALNLSKPVVAMNNDINVTIVAFEKLTRTSPDSFRSDASYVVAEVGDSNVTVRAVAEIEATEPIRSSPLVGWGLTPVGDEVFYLACNNGTTCCTLCFYPSLRIERTDSYRWGLPLPHIFSTHVESERWVHPLLCETASYVVYVWAFTYHEEAYYSYFPTYVASEATAGSFNILLVPVSVFLLSLVGFVALAVIGRKSNLIQLNTQKLKETWKYPVGLAVVFLAAVSANYIFAGLFCSGFVLVVNTILELLFVACLSIWVYDVLASPAATVGDKGETTPESTKETDSHSQVG